MKNLPGRWTGESGGAFSFLLPGTETTFFCRTHKSCMMLCGAAGGKTRGPWWSCGQIFYALCSMVQLFNTDLLVEQKYCFVSPKQSKKLLCFVGGQKRRKKREYNINTVYMLMSAPSQLSHSFHRNSTVCEDLLCVALCAHSEGIVMHSQCSIKHVVNVHNHQWQLEESI